MFKAPTTEHFLRMIDREIRRSSEATDHDIKALKAKAAHEGWLRSGPLIRKSIGARRERLEALVPALFEHVQRDVEANGASPDNIIGIVADRLRVHASQQALDARLNPRDPDTTPDTDAAANALIEKMRRDVVEAIELHEHGLYRSASVSTTIISQSGSNNSLNAAVAAPGATLSADGKAAG